MKPYMALIELSKALQSLVVLSIVLTANACTFFVLRIHVAPSCLGPVGGTHCHEQVTPRCSCFCHGQVVARWSL